MRTGGAKSGGWRRWGYRALICLAAGAVATVVVSWGFAVWGTTDGTLWGQTVRPPVPPGATSPGWGELAPEHLDWPVHAPAGWGSPRRVSWAVGRGVRLDAGIVEMHYVGDPGPWHVASGVRFGWPALSMQWRVAFVAEESFSTLVIPDGVVTGLKVPIESPIVSSFHYSPAMTERRLPLLPVWPGFVVNTAVYALVAAGVWGALCVPRALRTRRRRRRGLCLACGYAVGGLTVCPECGGEAAGAVGRPVARTKPGPA